VISFDVQKVIKLVGLSILVIFICNLLFTLIYMSSVMIPKDKVIESLRKSEATGVLKTPLGSIERSTTGLGLDYGTECAAISVGLKDKPMQKNVNKLFSRFYDGYLVQGRNLQTFDPCSGLRELINPSNSSLKESGLISYARNWWGMSIFIQLGILLFGLASVKTYLFIATIIFVSIFYYKFSKLMSDWKPGIFLLAPLILFGDFQEIHNSFPYSLFTIQLFTSSLILIKVLKSPKFEYLNLFLISITMSSIYNFVFWLDFHIVITFVSAVIYLILVNKETIMEIYKKIFIFLSGYIVGFITTTIIKWTLSIFFFGAEVRETIGTALQVRLSAGTDGLNGPLLDYSSTFSSVPVPIRAVFLNAMVFASKIVDPRNASALGIVIIFLLFLFLFLKFVNTYKPTKILGKRNFLAFIPVFLIPYVYIMLTANHSFNHAVLIYRAIPVSVGFLLSLIHVMYAQNEMFLSTNEKKSND
jgi:hypothetical protein